MIVVGTEISSGGRARASIWVAMQACTVNRFPVPYRNRTIFHISILTVLYGFGPYRTVTVPYIRSENRDTAYKHSTDHYCVSAGAVSKAMRHGAPRVLRLTSVLSRA